PQRLVFRFALTIAEPRSSFPNHLSQRGSHGSGGGPPCCKFSTCERLRMLNSRSCSELEKSVQVAAVAGRGRRGACCSLTLALLVPMLLALGGCASGYNGLPPNIGFPTAAGFRVVSTTLSPAVAGRTYSFYVLLNGGTAPINCSSGVSGLPANLSATYVTVPTGPVAGTGACLISGTVAATAVAGSPYALTFNLQDTSAAEVVRGGALVSWRYGANGPTGAAPNMAPVATTTL